MKIKDILIHLLGGYTTLDIEYIKNCERVKAYNNIRQRISNHELNAVYNDTEKLHNLLIYVSNCAIHYNILRNSIYGNLIIRK